MQLLTKAAEDSVMTRRARQILTALGLGLVVVASGFQLSRVFFEAPEYKVVERNDQFEIREYRSRIVAETVVEANDREAAVEEGFTRLGNYIFGANTKGAGSSRIAMTVPVEAKSEEKTRIAMTTPVEATGQNNRWTITFTMPKEYALNTLPTPKDPRVVLRERDGETVAVARFSGFVDPTTRQDREAALLRAVDQAGYTTTGSPTIAVYDPPSVVLPMFRRNEVIVPVRKTSGASASR
jgi:hypothetical protein